MDEHNLLSISPLDGRYATKVDYLSQYFSEAALMRYRVLTEIEWFIFLFGELGLRRGKLKATELRLLRSIYEEFDVINARRLKEIEDETNHDVKAAEYFIKEQLKGGPFEKFSEFIHFACTSEDINNLAYACMVRDFVERDFVPLASGLVQEIYSIAIENRSLAMVSRTHGQVASPTTLGKEMVNFVARMEKELERLSSYNYCLPGKINGAVGNFNAHKEAYGKVDWIELSKKFVQTLGLEPNLYTTQIEPHDGFACVFDSVKRLNNIILDFDRDMWGYISLGYFGQSLKKDEVGSSTMPHKVNPIDFENSEGNLGVANALFEHMSSKLQVSRFQRDLSDSTVQRNMGTAFAYSVLAYKSTIKGLSKCIVNKKVIQDDLKDRWEVLAEPIQVVMKKHLVPNAYEQLKKLTRGKSIITQKTIQAFIKTLKIPAADKKALLKLTPATYTGLAAELVDSYQLKVAVSNSDGCGGSCGSCSMNCG